ncbi:hypothetical protein Tco_1172049, partial [Tanacetum coccineum]
GSNFLQSFGSREGSYDPMFIQIDIHAILHMQRRLFELRGCLLLVSRDDIDSKDFTIYEMLKGSPVWTVRKGKLIEYNIISNTISQIFDIGSNQMDDEYEFFPAYKVDHYTYEFIPYFAGV